MNPQLNRTFLTLPFVWLTLLLLAGPAPSARGALLITEFMAAEEGDAPDWIEICNSGTNSVDLRGYYLTDDAQDLRKWRFPSTPIPPMGYLLVFASGDNRAVPCFDLHTNFRLSSKGDYLALIDPDGLILSEFAPTYPAQSPDISYGRDPNDPSVLGFFGLPTPGAENPAPAVGFGPEVEFSRASGRFSESFQLTLSVPPGHPGTVIHYTLNNEPPTELSPLYSGAIMITNSALVRARAFQPDRLPGLPHSESYLMISADTQEFSSDLPIVIVHTFGRPFPGTATFVPSYFELIEPTGGRTLLTNVPSVSTRIGLQNRGSSTAGQPKRNMRVELWDELDDDKPMELLGLPSDSDFILYAPNNFEPIEIHNPFIYEISRKMGPYASRTRYVEVFLVVGNGPVTAANYNGLYVLMETLKFAPERIDQPSLRPNDVDFPEITGGYLLKIDRSAPGEPGFVAGGQTVQAADPNVIEFRDPQRRVQQEYITKYIDDFALALNGPFFRDPVRGYAPYIDTASWIDHSLLNVLAFNVDALRLSTFFYKEREGKLAFGPIWDFDRALGSTDGRDSNPRIWSQTASSTEFFSNVTQRWWGTLFRDIDFWQKWIDRWQELRRDLISTTNLNAMVDAHTDEIREAVARDHVRWAGWINPRGGFSGEITHMKNWLSNRTDFIDHQFQDPPTFSSPGGNISPGFTLHLSVQTAGPRVMYYTLDGSDPRARGGEVADNALAYSEPIVLTDNARVTARVLNPNHQNLTGGSNPQLSSPWSGVVAETYVVSTPPLAITEIMYHPPPTPPDNPYADEDYEFIELENIGSIELDLSGFRLTEGVEFDFDESAISALAPGARIVLVKNLAAFRTRYDIDNVGGEYQGNLANSSERIVLLGPLHEPVVDLTYVDTWLPVTDGFGHALHRKSLSVDNYDDPATWETAVPDFETAGVGSSAPVITLQPTSQTALAYANVAFSVEAQGDAPLYYQWQLNGENLPGETESTLALNNVKDTDAGTYRVTVFDAFRATVSAPAQLRINYLTVILEPPADLTVVKGSTANFSVTSCDHGGPVTYQWAHDGSDLEDATNATLAIANAQTNNAGAYTVSITGELGTFSTPPAELTVLVRPTFLTSPLTQTAVVGDIVTMSVTMDGTEPFGYRWRRNGRTVVGFDEGQPTLVLNGVQTTDTGRYNVVATNAATLSGVLSGTAVLTVWADEDGDHMADEWEAANGLDPEDENDAGVDSDGDGMTALEEYRAGTDPNDELSYLKLEQVTLDSGAAAVQFMAYSNRAYHVEWKESVDYGKWAMLGVIPAHVTNRWELVNDPYPLTEGRLYRVVAPPQPPQAPGPMILRSPRSGQFALGDDVVLHVVAAGTPPLKYQWRFNDDTIPDGIASSLIITDLQPANAGSYTVVVSDQFGSTTNHPPAILTIQP